MMLKKKRSESNVNVECKLWNLTMHPAKVITLLLLSIKSLYTSFGEDEGQRSISV